MSGFGALFAGVVLVILHRVDGAEVAINPAHVVTLYSASVEQPHRHITSAARCAVGLSSGKLIGTLESCDEVKRLIEEASR